MEFPIRCFTCGAVIAHLYDSYKNLCKDKSTEEVLNDLGIERYCCRRMFISHVPVIGTMSKYPRV